MFSSDHHYCFCLIRNPEWFCVLTNSRENSREWPMSSSPCGMDIDRRQSVSLCWSPHVQEGSQAKKWLHNPTQLCHFSRPYWDPWGNLVSRDGIHPRAQQSRQRWSWSWWGDPQAREASRHVLYGELHVTMAQQSSLSPRKCCCHGNYPNFLYPCEWAKRSSRRFLIALGVFLSAVGLTYFSIVCVGNNEGKDSGEAGQLAPNRAPCAERGSQLNNTPLASKVWRDSICKTNQTSNIENKASLNNSFIYFHPFLNEIEEGISLLHMQDKTLFHIYKQFQFV